MGSKPRQPASRTLSQILRLRRLRPAPFFAHSPPRDAEHADRASNRRCVISRASARSRSEPLASSTPLSSSCRTKSSKRSSASASRNVKSCSIAHGVEGDGILPASAGLIYECYQGGWAKVWQRRNCTRADQAPDGVGFWPRDARLTVMVSLRDVFLARAIFQLVGQRPGSLRIGKLDPDLGHCILVILRRASSAKAARTKAHVAGIF